MQLCDPIRRPSKLSIYFDARDGSHPEGWTLYPVPGPTFKGAGARSDYCYLSWVDRENTLGLGRDVPVIR
jgi:hypothetical protein